MVTPELQDYVNQSRSSGVSDDQIRQTLLQQGWEAADVDAALGSSATAASATTISSASNVASAGHMGRTIAIIVGVLVLLGGVFFAYSYFSSTSSDSDSQVGLNNNNNNESSSLRVNCENILSASDFRRIMGKDLSVVYTGGGFKEEFKEYLGVQEEEFHPGGGQLVCGYNEANSEVIERYQGLDYINDNMRAAVSDVSISIVSTGEDITENFEATKADPYESLGEGTHTFGGQRFTIRGDMVIYEEGLLAGREIPLASLRSPKTELSGIGASAYQDKEGTVTVLSSSKLYIISVLKADGSSDENSARIEIAKVVSANVD